VVKSLGNKYSFGYFNNKCHLLFAILDYAIQNPVNKYTYSNAFFILKRE
jgi:FlaA1/EpsC-like NDP-sugar epimerase